MASGNRLVQHGLGYAVALFLALPACSSATSNGVSANNRQIQVVATTTQIADFARVVGGEHVHVISLSKPGVDPHEFQESPADVEALRTAAIIARNGAGLDAWLDPLIANSDTHAIVVDTSAHVTLRTHAGERDPHIWTNPLNAKAMAQAVTDSLRQVDPANSASYSSALAAYSQELDKLDQEITVQFSKVVNKKFVTTHDSLGYFSDRYKLEFVGSVIPGFDTNSEVTAQQINDLVTAVKQSGVRAIFTESSLPTKAANALASQTHVKVISGPDALYGDTLGLAGSAGDTYLKMMRHNALVIANNL